MSRPVRVLLVPVDGAPRESLLPTDPGGGHLEALTAAVGGTVECVRLLDGTDLWCNDDALWLGLPLNRRVPGVAPEVPPGFEDMEPLVLVERLCRPGEEGEWQVHGDFLLARHDGEGGMADLTDRDVERWTLWLELDALLRGGRR